MKHPAFVCCAVSFLFLGATSVQAQETSDLTDVHFYPPSAVSMMKYIDYPVSHRTGIPEISIPLYTVRSGSLELPVNLSFHLDDFTRVNQLAGAAGAGWSLSCDLQVSRIINGRAPGSAPMTLLDYFPKDFLLFVDESHVTLPQVRAMYRGDRARKDSLVEYGFRLPSAYDNRPLKFEEFEQRVHQAIYVSATPGDYEREHAGQIAEQIIRPTGLLDPQIFVRPIEGQIDDLIGEINARIAKNERALVTTLTKKMAEDLSAYLTNAGIRCRYLHHDIGAIERMEIIRDLRTGAFDVLVGINLLREGLDLPEVSLVAILDADKEGFLRSETSLIQTIGRAARNAEGTVIMYADKETAAMHAAIMETNRRRAKQAAYNAAHGIVPRTIVKGVRELLEISGDVEAPKRADGVKMTEAERRAEIARLEAQMKKAAEMLEYEYAAVLRDRLIELRGQ